mgnify:CR=1 FL=1
MAAPAIDRTQPAGAKGCKGDGEQEDRLLCHYHQRLKHWLRVHGADREGEGSKGLEGGPCDGS